MVQEESHHQHLHCQPRHAADGGGAGTGVARASKKSKAKKVPQRGLGVAQLERLRIEEQKKNAAMSTTASSPHPLRHAGLGLLPPLHPPPPPSALSRHVADLGAQMRHPAVPTSASPPDFFPVLWNAMDPTTHPFRRSQCSKPHVPVVSTGLSLRTAPTSHQAEPPSNQMASSSSWSSLVSSLEEERETVGVKRPWPFQIDGLPPVAAFPGKGPRFAGAGRTMSELVSGDGNPDMIRYEFRANALSSSGSAKYAADWRDDAAHCKSSKEHSNVWDAGFLTLSTHPVPVTNQSQAMPPPPPPLVPEHGELSFVPSQGSFSRLPFYSFLPVGPVHCEKPVDEWKAGVSDGVDLDLKLWKS